ncbi:MAG: hypothetical protein OEZ05_16670 [Nitrospirota bacterium]|nr:hypothetical protein [Nitrospirota bacterium]
MLFQQTLYINPTLRPSMANIGISEFKDFAKYSEGTLVSRPSKRQVRTVYLDVAGHRKKYFLKKAGPQSVREILKAWCCYQRPCSEMARELLIIQLFRDQGIPVMNPVAWGERKGLGWSMGGFMLVEEVVGREFVEVYQTASPQIRRRLMRVYGELLGTLHQKGIDSKVHPRDLICTSEDYETFRKCLVVIDRERGQTDLVDLSLQDRGKRLGEIWVKGSFTLGRAGMRELFVFLSSYCSVSGMKRGRRTWCRNLVQGILGRATDILAHDRRFSSLRLEFREKYGVGH